MKQNILSIGVSVVFVFVVGCASIQQTERVVAVDCVARNMGSLIFVTQRAAELRNTGGGIYFVPKQGLTAYAAGHKQAVIAFLEDMSRMGHITYSKIVE